MSITIVATAGSASANSFATVAEADAYLEARLNSSAWTGTEPKKQALVEATREISRLAYQGYRVDETQALSWPRYLCPNPDGISTGSYYETTELPTRIVEATIELALEFLKAGTTDIAAKPGTRDIIEETVDVITTRYADPSQRAVGLAQFPRVTGLIEPLLAVGSGQVRLVR